MNKAELKNIIFAKLTGEGGLSSDFVPYMTANNDDYKTKTYNMEFQRILARILSDEAFFDKLSEAMIDKYEELCQRRGLPGGYNFDRIMTAYDCCLWARFFGLRMMEEERQTNEVVR